MFKSFFVLALLIPNLAGAKAVRYSGMGSEGAFSMEVNPEAQSLDIVVRVFPQFLSTRTINLDNGKRTLGRGKGSRWSAKRKQEFKARAQELAKDRWSSRHKLLITTQSGKAISLVPSIRLEFVDRPALADHEVTIERYPGPERTLNASSHKWYSTDIIGEQPGEEIPTLTSVFEHEFGHLLGAADDKGDGSGGGAYELARRFGLSIPRFEQDVDTRTIMSRGEAVLPHHYAGILAALEKRFAKDPIRSVRIHKNRTRKPASRIPGAVHRK